MVGRMGWRGVGLAVAMTASTVSARGQTPAPVSSMAPVATQAQAAWLRVRQALTPLQQAYQVRNFIAASTAEQGRRPDMAVDARDVASGRAVRLDDPILLQRPQALEVTVTMDGRFYTFRPLSRASLEPLLTP